MSEVATAPAGITVECGKPNCHWKGSPADAPTHPCPTPDPDAAAVAVLEMADAPEGLKEAAADALVRSTAEPVLDGALVDEDPADTIAYDADPTAEAELEEWLGAYGAYNDAGVPQDEKTATLDARYAILTAAGRPPDFDEIDALEPLDGSDPEPAPPVASDEVAKPEEAAEPALAEPPADEEALYDDAMTRAEPWQRAIFLQNAEQPDPKAYRWLVVVHHADSRHTLLARGKTKVEATVIAEDAAERGILQGEIEVVKLADVEKAAVAAEADAIGVRLEDEAAEDEKRSGTAFQDDDPPSSDEIAALVHSPNPAEQAAAVRHAASKEKAALFDADAYKDPALSLPEIDGHGIDRIAVTFTGEVMLDRHDKDHVALFRRIKLGQEVELWVQGRGFGFQAKPNTKREGDLDVVVAKRAIAVQHVRVMDPEDLAEAALEVASQARDAGEAEDARDRAKAADEAEGGGDE